MKSFKTEGIIIKRKNFGEADKIITILTKHYGKIYVKASGVRKISSRRSSHVELLNYSLLSLYRGQAYPILSEAQTINDFFYLKNDLQKITIAFHLCELVDSLCPDNQEQEKVFDLLFIALMRLSKQVNSPSQMDSLDNSNQLSRPYSVKQFEIDLLIILGYLDQSEQRSLDTHLYIENIIERKLKTYPLFARLQEF